jgi:hypothetical protein
MIHLARVDGVSVWVEPLSICALVGVYDKNGTKIWLECGLDVEVLESPGQILSLIEYDARRHLDIPPPSGPSGAN